MTTEQSWRTPELEERIARSRAYAAALAELPEVKRDREYVQAVVDQLPENEDFQLERIATALERIAGALERNVG